MTDVYLNEVRWWVQHCFKENKALNMSQNELWFVRSMYVKLRTTVLWVVIEVSKKVENPVLFHKLVMLILEDFGGGLGVVEQLVDFLHLLPLHGLFALNTAQQTGWRQQLYSIPERKQEVRADQDQRIHGESGKDRHHFSTTYISLFKLIRFHTKYFPF